MHLLVLTLLIKDRVCPLHQCLPLDIPPVLMSIHSPLHNLLIASLQPLLSWIWWLAMSLVGWALDCTRSIISPMQTSTSPLTLACQPCMPSLFKVFPLKLVMLSSLLAIRLQSATFDP